MILKFDGVISTYASCFLIKPLLPIKKREFISKTYKVYPINSSKDVIIDIRHEELEDSYKRLFSYNKDGSVNYK